MGCAGTSNRPKQSGKAGEQEYVHFLDDDDNKMYLINLFSQKGHSVPLPVQLPLYCDSIQYKNRIYITGGKKITNNQSYTQLATTSLITFSPPLKVSCSSYIPPSESEARSSGVPQEGGDLAERTPTLTSTLLLPLKSYIKTKASMPVSRQFHATTISGEFLYALGGESNEKYIESTHRYHMSLNKWQTLPSLAQAKIFLCACVFNDIMLYAFGGYDGETHLQTIEQLNVKEEMTAWSTVKLKESSSQLLGVKWGGVLCLKDGIVLFGGDDGDEFRDEAMWFSPVEEELSESDHSLNAEEHFLNRKAVVYEKNAFIVGYRLGDLNIYDIQTKEWSSMEKKEWIVTLEGELPQGKKEEVKKHSI
jgi:hypothetical protein